MCTVHARAVVGRLETTPQATASAQPQSQSRPGTPDLRCPPVNRRRAVTLVGMSAPHEYPRGLVSDSRGSLPEEPHAPDVLIIEYVPAQQGYALSPRSKLIGVRTATAVILPNPTDSAAAESNSSAGLLSTRRVHEPARPQPPEAVWCSRWGADSVDSRIALRGTRYSGPPQASPADDGSQPPSRCLCPLAGDNVAVAKATFDPPDMLAYESIQVA